ncbi:MAG: hypothetical protein AABX12_01615 [Nanoarchaeota archaeon]
MIYKTIKISEENYKHLLDIATALQERLGRRVSFDEALHDKLNKKRGDIMKLAGSWKMSDKEAEKLLGEIYSERKVVSRRIR